MKAPHLTLALTVVNLVLLAYLVARPSPIAGEVAPVLRGHALEIVDDHGRVRASINVIPADPSVRMPDGTAGYPETVLLRLITSKGRPNVKISATEDGSALGLGGAADPAYAQLLARGATMSLKLTNENGKVQLIEP